MGRDGALLPEEIHPGGLILFHALGSAKSPMNTVLIHGDCHQNSHISKLSAQLRRR